MALPAFDTLNFAKRLREVGVPEPQAEVQVELLTEAIAERMATKDDLTKTETVLQQEIQGVKRDIQELDTKLEVEIQGVKRDIQELDTKLGVEIQGVKRDIKDLDTKLGVEIQGVKRDIQELNTKMEIRFEKIDDKFDKIDDKFKMLELRMVIKLGAMFLAGIGLLFGLLRMWPTPVQYIPPPGFSYPSPHQTPPNR